MSHIRVLICRVDDPASDQMTELAAFDLPGPNPALPQHVRRARILALLEFLHVIFPLDLPLFLLLL